MLIEKLESQLLLIDYQARLMPAIHEGTDVLQRATTLARIASLLQVPVWATEQNPDRLGSNDEALRALCSRTLPKMSFSGVDDELLSLLRPPAPAARPAMRGVFPSTCKSRSRPVRSATPSWWRGARPMSACSRRLWICLTRNSMSAWSRMPVVPAGSATVMLPSTDWLEPVPNW